MRCGVPGPGAQEPALADVIDVEYSEVGGGRDGVSDANLAIESRDHGESAWICPACSASIPFPATWCRECQGRVPLLSGAGLTSSLIAAAAAVGALIACIAALGSAG